MSECNQEGCENNITDGARVAREGAFPVDKDDKGSCVGEFGAVGASTRALFDEGLPWVDLTLRFFDLV